MLLFIGSEVMVFGSFFTVYFFVRVVQRAAGPTQPSIYRCTSLASTR